MNKKEFTKAFAEKAGLSQKDAKVVENALVETILEAVETGKVKLGDLVTFEKVEVAERSGEMAQPDGSKIEYSKPAHSKIVAKATKKYKNI